MFMPNVHFTVTETGRESSGPTKDPIGYYASPEDKTISVVVPRAFLENDIAVSFCTARKVLCSLQGTVFDYEDWRGEVKRQIELLNREIDRLGGSLVGGGDPLSHAVILEEIEKRNVRIGELQRKLRY